MFWGEIKRQIRRYGEKGRERNMVTKLEGEDRERGGREMKREGEER